MCVIVVIGKLPVSVHCFQRRATQGHRKEGCDTYRCSLLGYFGLEVTQSRPKLAEQGQSTYELQR